MVESLFLATTIVGFIELVKALNRHDWMTAEIITGAAVIGAIAGAFGIDNLTVSSGIMAGLTASGLFRLSENIGGMK